MEVRDICDLNNKSQKSLNEIITKSNSVCKLNMLLVTFNQISRSSYSRVAKYTTKCLTEYNSVNPNVNITNYVIKDRNINELLNIIKSQNIVFFITPFQILYQIIELLKNNNIPRDFDTWFYLKINSNIIDKTLIDWFNRELSVIFVPTGIMSKSLKKIINRPVEILDFGVSSNSFYQMDKINARKILNFDANRHIWLVPTNITPNSRLDTIIQSYIQYLLGLPDYSKEILLLIGITGDLDNLNIQDIYRNELISRNLNYKDFETNLVILDPEIVNNSLNDYLLNCFYNAADVIIFMNSFSNHSYSCLESFINPNTNIILPKHSWFADNFDTSNKRIFWCEPTQILYRALGEGGGIDYLVHPSDLLLKMRESIAKSDDSLDSISYITRDNTNNCLKILTKRIEIVAMSCEN